jgi:hypothetical protein
MFREPVWRDPLVVAWALVLAAATFVALSNNTEWSGTVQPDLVAGFLKDVADAFLWSFLLLLLLAWLRARVWLRDNARSDPRRNRATRRASHEPRTVSPLPWTDGWLGPHRAHAADERSRPSPTTEEQLPVRCRHGVPVERADDGRLPVLRALSVSHMVVPPGAEVSVTWCFDGARDVVVDGASGYSACGEARVRIDRSRRIDLAGRNRSGITHAATAEIVTVLVPQVTAPAVAAPPPVTLRTDVAASVGPAAPIGQSLDALWSTQDSLRPVVQTPPRLVGVPASVVRGLRRAPSTTKRRSQ